MWPNDADGNAIRGALGPLLKKAGYTIVDPGAYAGRDERLLGADLEVQVGELPDLQHVPDPARLRDVLAAGRAAGLQAGEDRADREDRAVPVAGRRRSARSATTSRAACYWHPTWPYTSSLTGITSKAARRRLREASGKQWNQQLGPSLALFDVAAAALKASGNPKDKAAVANAMKTLDVDDAVGHLDWATKRAASPNVVADADHRRPVGARRQRQVPARLRDLRALATTRTSRSRAKLKPYTA